MSQTLYGRHTSYNVQKVLWLLDELNIEYNHIELGGNPGNTETNEFVKLNPMQKIPVLVDGDKVIWESNTILRYLVSAYGSGAWIVDDAYQRSCYERWMDWAQTSFEPAFVGVFWGYYRTPPNLHDKEAINGSVDDCLDCLAKLDEQINDQQFLLGENLSLADITTGVFLYRLVEIDLNIMLPNQVVGWYHRLQESQGYNHWVMSDFSSLKGRLDY